MKKVTAMEVWTFSPHAVSSSFSHCEKWVDLIFAKEDSLSLAVKSKSTWKRTESVWIWGMIPLGVGLYTTCCSSTYLCWFIFDACTDVKNY